MEEEIYQKVTRLETKIEEHSKLLDKQQERNDAQTELNIILKMNAENMKKFSDTLDRVDLSLNNLNNSQQQMKQEMSAIGNRVNDIEKYQEDNKIDPFKLFKGILSYIATGIGSIAIAVLIWLLTEGNK